MSLQLILGYGIGFEMLPYEIKVYINHDKKKISGNLFLIDCGTRRMKENARGYDERCRNVRSIRY
jgi:hypothetical protein